MEDHYNLRPHQEEAIGTLLKQLQKGNKKNLLYLAPGSGTTTIIEVLIKQSFRKLSRRALILCPSKAYEEQFSHRIHDIKKLYPILDTKNLSAALSTFDKNDSDIIPKDYDLIILPDYIETERLTAFLHSYPTAIKIAFSSLVEDSEYFGSPIFHYSLKNAIEDQMLVPLIIHKIKIDKISEELDISKNFILSSDNFISHSVSIILEKTKTEKTLVFCPTIRHAQIFSEKVNILTANKNYARVISSEQKQVTASIHGYTDGIDGPYLLCIVDMMHFSLPMTKHIAILRPTRSIVMLQKMLKWGMVRYADKKELNIYDFVGLDDVFKKLTPDIETLADETVEHRFEKAQIKFRDRQDIEGVLGVDVLSEELADILERMPSEPGCLVGIFGKWGRGKTFFMDHTWNILGGKKKFIRVDFHAWKYQDTPATWAYLYECLAEQYFTSKGKYKLTRFVSKTYKRIRLNFKRNGIWPLTKLAGIFVLGIFVSLLIKEIEESDLKIVGYAFTGIATIYGITKTYAKEYSIKARDLFLKYSSKQSFKEHLGLQAEIQKETIDLLKTWIPEKQKGKKKILIFVDDIDRCNEQKIVELIDALRVLTEAKEIADRVLLVAAIDEEILKRAIKIKYHTLIAVDKKEDLYTTTLSKVTIEYLDKLFIAGIKLGKLSESDTDEFLVTLTKADRLSIPLASLSDLKQKEIDEINNRFSPSLYDQDVIDQYLDAQDDEQAYIDSYMEQINNQGGYTPEYLPKGESKKPITMQTTYDKLNHEEVDILRLALSKYEDITPRQVRIFYFRYLIAKNLLIRHYDKLGRNNIWQERKRTAILVRMITQYSLSDNYEMLEKHNSEIQKSTDNYHQIPFYQEVYVDMEDYKELLKVLTVVIAY